MWKKKLNTLKMPKNSAIFSVHALFSSDSCACIDSVIPSTSMRHSLLVIETRNGKRSLGWTSIETIGIERLFSPQTEYGIGFSSLSISPMSNGTDHSDPQSTEHLMERLIWRNGVYSRWSEAGGVARRKRSFTVASIVLNVKVDTQSRLWRTTSHSIFYRI